MAGVNKVILLGNLGADPEVKYLEGDNVVANLRLATTESYKDKNGNRVDQTEWHDLELWGPQAKIAEQYLKKGSQIFVEGKIKSDAWQDDQGQNRKRIKVRVINFTMLGGKPDSMNGAVASTQAVPTAQAVQRQTASVGGSGSPEISMDSAEDDLPF